ncbi:membrane-spanning 4-domains subfamily A member 4A-like [Clarias gariepinus]|uniref:membrane-spanning 4-domains subfamily A member 4A-like n=1 Tax=Clarias gariepinus TaxID=13013 RepID=UPI00234CA904|nr:membrane-spanning 4-domains subfamily A member 4A-like [Clarias gariepinus]
MASAPVPLTNVESGFAHVTQVVSSTAGQNPSQMISPLQKFLKGEPKALGTVQIMIGVMSILFGIVIGVDSYPLSMYTGVVFWGSLFHISAGSLAVAASNKLNTCVVRVTMVLNIITTVASGFAIIAFSLDLTFGPYRIICSYYTGVHSCHMPSIEVSRTSGIIGVLLVFSVLQFAISIVISAFTCKATCSDQPTLNVINMIPNLENQVPVAGSTPAHQAPLGDSTMNAVAMSSPTLEGSPVDSKKSQTDHVE